DRNYVMRYLKVRPRNGARACSDLRRRNLAQACSTFATSGRARQTCGGRVKTCVGNGASVSPHWHRRRLDRRCFPLISWRVIISHFQRVRLRRSGLPSSQVGRPELQPDAYHSTAT
ncbi:unnamed protein product, partial [Nesidiocoris tenuis]